MINLKEMEINEIIKLLGLADELKPIIKEVVGKSANFVVDSASELKPIFETLIDWIVERNIRTLEMYRSAGLSDELAVHLITATLNNIKSSSVKSNGKSNK